MGDEEVTTLSASEYGTWPAILSLSLVIHAHGHNMGEVSLLDSYRITSVPYICHMTSSQLMRFKNQNMVIENMNIEHPYQILQEHKPALYDTDPAAFRAKENKNFAGLSFEGQCLEWTITI